MPSRQNTKTITTPIDIQGENAWVKIKSITIQEAKDLQNLSIEIDNRIKPERERLFKEFADSNNLDVKSLDDSQKVQAMLNSEATKEAEKFLYSYYADYVLGWNWVTEKDDENGEPIPMAQPYHNPDVFETLTVQEFSHIQSLFKDETASEKK
jgi:hypothetical protein